MMKWITASLAFLFSLSTVAQDASPRISGDRPGFGVSTLNMPAGLFQAELGYQADLVQVQGFGINDWTHRAPATLRYGITSWLEVKSDITYSHDVFESADKTEFSGIQPIALGGRLTVLDDQDALFKMLLYGTVGIPLNDHQRSTSDLRIMLTKQLTSSVSIDGNLGLLIAPQNRLQYSIGGNAAVSDGVSFFAEFFGYYYNRINEGFIDGGLIFYPSNNIQIDVSAGRRILITAGNINIIADETYTFFSIGGAFRIPE